jgi:integrase
MAIHKLSEAKIAKLKDGKYGDGGGLWLQVSNNGAGKSWYFRWKDRQTGQGRVMGLGAIYKVDIAQARDLAKAQWQLINAGLDPVAVRDGAKLDQAHKQRLVKTVNETIDAFLDAKVMLRNRSPWTKRQAVMILKIARDTIGDLPIQKIDTNKILDTVGIRTMWKEKHPTAAVLLSYLHRLFSYAITNKYFVGENPARWTDHLEHVLPAHRDMHRTVHYEAISYKEIGRFMQEVRGYQDRSYRDSGHPVSMLLLEYIILTGCRISEARLAKWSHIDRTNLIWTVPEENHKIGAHTGEPVLRPITKPMLAVLDEMKRRYPDHTLGDLIFPSYWHGRTAAPFNTSSMVPLLHRSLKTTITVHGFRSTFTDWCRANGYPKELYDAQTGHVVGDVTHRAYARDQLIDQRRPMMEHWGQWCAQPAPKPVEGANIENFVERKKRAAP